MASYQWDFSQSVQGSNFSLRIIVDTTTGKLSITGLSGSGDINAIWLDYPGGDNTTSLPSGSQSVNMNGTGIAWDDVAVLSRPGLGPAGENKSTFITPGETLEFSLASLGFGAIADWSVVTVGVRATSVNGGGSVKLVDTTAEPVGPVNDPPVISIGPGDSDAATIPETNSPLTTNGKLTVTDLNNDSLTAIVTGVTVNTTGPVALPASLNNPAFLAMLNLNFDASDPNTNDGIRLDWNFNSVSETFDFLTECPTHEAIELVYAIQVSDGKGGTATDTITVTITATNDIPTVNAPGAPGDDLTGAVTELPANDPNAGSATLTDSGSFAFFDLDINDVQTVAVSAAAVTAAPAGYGGGVLGTLNVSVGDPATGDGTGKINWSYSVADSAIGFLREGETITQVYTVKVTDDCGANVNQDVTITLTGENDNPVAAPDLLYVSNRQTFVNLPAALLLFNDTDDGGKANLTITSITGPLWDDDKNPTTPDVQSVKYNPVSGQFSFVSDAIGINAGDEGSLTYTLADSQGGSASGTVNVRLVDTNDGPDNVFLGGSYTCSFLALNTGKARAEGEKTVFASEAQVDFFFGDNGPDKLIGGAGNDVLTGGTSPDEFRMIAPTSNGTDLLIDFRTIPSPDDMIYLLQGGDGWNAAGSSPTGDNGENLAASDYLSISQAGFGAAAKNNKVVGLSEAVAGDSAITSLTSINADNAYVLLFNSVSSRGEIWWDDNWSNSSGRLKIATINSLSTPTSVTNANQTYFGEWAH
ncbi:MAG: VCBS domain-containing protein [Cyanobium sp.]